MIPKSEIVLNGIQLSRIALGTHTFCDETEKTSMEILDEFVLNGGNVIDTGRCYGDNNITDPNHEPESERCIGSWFNSSGMREKMVLITKGGNPEYQNGKFVRHRLNAQDIELDINKSLEELKTDYIDIYFLHKDNPDIEPGEAIEILNKYVKNGTVKHIGASNWSAKRIEEANLYAKKHGLAQFECSELCFSLKDGIINNEQNPEFMREVTYEDYKYYQNTGMPVFGYASQAHGFFYKDLDLSKVSEKNREILRKLNEICLKKQINNHQGLFGFYFNCGINNIPIISAKTISRLHEVIDNCNIILDKDEVECLLENKFGIGMI